MEFSVTLTITDECICNGKVSKVEKTTTITSTSDTIKLQCSYILNIIDVNDDGITVLIQDGINVYIRNIFYDIDSRICLCCKCAEHLVTISVSESENSE